MTPKLTPAQARTFAEITEAKPITPDKKMYWWQTWRQADGGRVYGRFNSATLRSLEAKGLIKVHHYGNGGTDEIEVLGPQILKEMLECR
jgi:hypothetical protein